MFAQNEGCDFSSGCHRNFRSMCHSGCPKAAVYPSAILSSSECKQHLRIHGLTCQPFCDLGNKLQGSLPHGWSTLTAMEFMYAPSRCISPTMTSVLLTSLISTPAPLAGRPFPALSRRNNTTCIVCGKSCGVLLLQQHYSIRLSHPCPALPCTCIRDFSGAAATDKQPLSGSLPSVWSTMTLLTEL